MWYIASRRSPLQIDGVTPTHAGLYLDKYIDKVQIKGQNIPPKTTDPRQEVIADAAKISVPSLYRNFYPRWQATLTELGAICKPAHSLGRIAIGLGGESVQETAITIHRTYGVPYLPGSALKGLTASFAAKHIRGEWARDSEAYRVVFGDTNQAGYITFFDAYPDPTSGPLLHPDIMAIHHPSYYQGQDAAPADWDDPSLVPFPTATGRYLVALAGPQAEWARPWVDKTFQILGYALEEMGIGAKTASGYGRMKLEGAGSAIVPGAAQTPQDPPVESYELAKRRLLNEQPAAGRQRGVVTKVIHRSEGSTFGFITPARGGGDIHVYESRLIPSGELRERQIVEFSLPPAPGGNKRPSAETVVVLRQP